MAILYNANLMIRESRKAQGLTQEQLAEGICSRETIVKLEKGERKPNWFIIKEILLRLGLDPEIYSSDVGSEEDVYVLQRMNKCHCFIVAYDFEEAKTEIDSIEAEKNTSSGKMWQSGLGYELFLRAKASFYSLDVGGRNKYLNPVIAIEYALECLQITRPGFDVEKIPDYYLATHEYRLLTSLALAHEHNNIVNALDLWRKLKANIEKNYGESIRSNANEWYRDLLNNIAIALFRNELYEECLGVAESGLSLARATYNMLHFCTHLTCKAYCLMKLGREDEGKPLCKKAILLAYALDGTAGQNFVSSKSEYEEMFGGKLELDVEW